MDVSILPVYYIPLWEYLNITHAAVYVGLTPKCNIQVGVFHWGLELSWFVLDSLTVYHKGSEIVLFWKLSSGDICG